VYPYLSIPQHTKIWVRWRDVAF